MKAIQIISQDVFDKIRSRFQNLEMGDETGAVTADPVEARFFDFDFVNEGVNLGRVSISINDAGSLKVYYSQGITENQDTEAKHQWYNFLKEMRKFAMRRLLRFDTRDIAKSNLDKNDFKYLASKPPKDEDEMTTMNESKWNSKNSKKTSRAVRGSTEVIVRHAHPVEETFPGARSQRKNIKSIFIQNREGERFKYPFIHPAGAFAMAQHVDHGGVPHDPAGKAIISMSEEIAQLQEFQRKVQRSQLHADAVGITERAMAKLNELKLRIESISKRKNYEMWLAEFNESNIDSELLDDLDPVTLEDYKSKFTETNFKEDLLNFFPLLHKIMKEANKIDLESYVGETGDGKCSGCGKPVSKCKCDHKSESRELSEFENWADTVEQGKLTDDQIEELRVALEPFLSSDEKLQLGPDGTIAWNFFSDHGITDTDLENDLKSAASLDSETDPLEVMRLWAQDNYPELLVALGISDESEPEQPAPTNEESSVDSQGSSLVNEVAKIIKSFYNAANENVGPFRGHEGILIDVEKTIGEKFGDKAGAKARQMAEAYMQKLTKQWEERHGKPAPAKVDDDGIARLKELVSNIKQRVEGIGDQGEGGEDFNKNIMPAEGYWKDAVKAADKSRKERNGKPFEKNPASHDEAGVYKGDKDLASSPVPKSKSKSVSEELATVKRLSGLR